MKQNNNPILPDHAANCGERTLTAREHRAHNTIFDIAKCLHSLSAISILFPAAELADVGEAHPCVVIGAFVSRMQKDVGLLLAMFEGEEHLSIEMFEGVGE